MLVGDEIFVFYFPDFQFLLPFFFFILLDIRGLFWLYFKATHSV